MGRLERLFQPIQIGSVTAKNRLEAAPTLTGMANLNGTVSSELINYHKSVARGGAGIVTVGESAIDGDYAPTHFAQLVLDSDPKIPGLGRIVDAIHQYGALASIELCHGGGQTFPGLVGGRRPIAPSRIVCAFQEQLAGCRIEVEEMNRDQIEQVIDNFGSAALRAKRAGFDMILLHGGHGWLLGQFVSPLDNKRTDEYGGSFENRARFVLRVLDRIRETCGRGLAIEYRFSVDELTPGGLTAEEGIAFARLIEDKVDCFQASAGLTRDARSMPRVHPVYFFPPATNLEFARQLKQAVSKPVTTVGGVNSLETAEQAVAEGSADIVAMARALIADPGLPGKGLRGREDEVIPCMRCNECMALGYRHRPLRCAANPRTFLETDYARLPATETRQKVVVVGGGPAGMEAAVVAAERGHEVVLFERQGHLGGNLTAAARLSFKADTRRFLEYMVRRVEALPIDLRLGTRAETTAVTAEKPDHLVLAVGAEPVGLDLPGVSRGTAVWAGDLLNDAPDVGDSVLVAGGGGTGCETALHLAQMGKMVTIVEMLAEPALDFNYFNRPVLLELLDAAGVEVRTKTTVMGITPRGLAVRSQDGTHAQLLADSVVLSLGMRSRTAEVEALRGLAPWEHVVGDCRKPRLIIDAVREGFYAAVDI